VRLTAFFIAVQRRMWAMRDDGGTMGDQSRDAGDAVNTRRWSRPSARVLLSALVACVSVGLLLWVAPPEDVIDAIGHLNPVWVLVAVGLELASCLSYVVLFRRFFPEPPRPVGRRVAWIAMGAGAVLPGGNISSAAATGLLLHGHGVDTRRLVERCAALLCLLTAFGFLINGVAGVLLLAGVPGGPHDLSHAGVPILVSAGVLSAAALAMFAARRLGPGGPRVLRGVASGLEGAWGSVGTPHWRLLGAAGFLGLDMATLWAACMATGHPIGPEALVIGYCIGYLATTIPVPAGIGVLDSGLAAALVLYGLSPAASVSAVLVYHAISIWVPGVGGLIAWLPTRVRRPRPEPATAPGLLPSRLAWAADGEE
jgi:uncharacterized membrane protein YbhN (UPF0104 family)